MVERAKELWYQWIPGWLPVCVCILSGAIWVGRYTQGIDDRLKSLEEQVKAIQQYISSDHQHSVMPAGYLGDKGLGQ
jgi:hypothetical protein